MAPRLLDGDEDERCVLATATQDGAPRALLHFVPWGTHGLSLDLISRDRTAPSGLAELLVAEVIRRAPELGVQRISLNFAAFREALELGQRIGAGPVLRAWRKVLLILSRWLQIEARYQFLAGFRPAWSPRFLVYPGLGTIPRVAVAALRAEARSAGLAASLRRLGRPRTAGRPSSAVNAHPLRLGTLPRTRRQRPRASSPPDPPATRRRRSPF